MPKVSVIIPVYNTEKYLRECLDSVVNQTLKDIEIICINDGSTDNSLSILEEYAQKDKRLKVYIYRNNKGGGAARNAGLRIAAGEYLAFLDSDDFYELEYCEKMYNKAVSTNAELVICHANSYNVQTNTYSKISWLVKDNYIPQKQVFNCRDMAHYIFNSFGNQNWNKLYKRKFISKNNILFQEIHRTNDLLFTCKALVLAERITVIPDRIVNYRTGQNSNCQSTNHKYPYDFYTAFQELHRYLIDENLYETFKQSYINWALSGFVYNIGSLKNIKVRRRLITKVFPSCFEDLDFKNISTINLYHKEAYNMFLRYFEEYKYAKKVFAAVNIRSGDRVHKVIKCFFFSLKLRNKAKEREIAAKERQDMLCRIKAQNDKILKYLEQRINFETSPEKEKEICKR